MLRKKNLEFEQNAPISGANAPRADQKQEPKIETWNSRPEYEIYATVTRRAKRRGTLYTVLVLSLLAILALTLAMLSRQLRGQSASAAFAEEVLTPTTALRTDANGLTWLRIGDCEILLVNKEYGLPSAYGYGLDLEAEAAFERMAQAAAKDDAAIWMVSGYRDYETQAALYTRNCARVGEAEASRFSAQAGHSEHQTGLAFDIAGSAKDAVLNEAFVDTPQYAWLAEHAVEYGFILRYPEGREWATGYIFEPWHYRYVGIELAAEIAASGKSLEEYAAEAADQTILQQT